MTKILYLKKVFSKIAIFSIKLSESKIFFRLTQATNTYKHTMTASMKASRKLAHDKGLLKKEKNCITIKKRYSSKSFLGG